MVGWWVIDCEGLRACKESQVFAGLSCVGWSPGWRGLADKHMRLHLLVLLVPRRTEGRQETQVLTAKVLRARDVLQVYVK